MAKTIFDHIDHILLHKDPAYYQNLSEIDKKTFTIFMLNRFLSMNIDFVPTINSLQPYTSTMPIECAYRVYSGIFPKRKVYLKYTKATGTTKYAPWMVDVIVKKYCISKSEATTYLTILFKTDLGKEEFRDMCHGFGIDQKFIKQIK